jgi:hypothetical protein
MIFLLPFRLRASFTMGAQAFSRRPGRNADHTGIDEQRREAEAGRRVSAP